MFNYYLSVTVLFVLLKRKSSFLYIKYLFQVVKYVVSQCSGPESVTKCTPIFVIGHCCSLLSLYNGSSFSATTGVI
jgi:hypothetical protein